MLQNHHRPQNPPQWHQEQKRGTLCATGARRCHPHTHMRLFGRAAPSFLPPPRTATLHTWHQHFLLTLPFFFVQSWFLYQQTVHRSFGRWTTAMYHPRDLFGLKSVFLLRVMAVLVLFLRAAPSTPRVLSIISFLFISYEKSDQQFKYFNTHFCKLWRISHGRAVAPV